MNRMSSAVHDGWTYFCKAAGIVLVVLFVVGLVIAAISHGHQTFSQAVVEPAMAVAGIFGAIYGAIGFFSALAQRNPQPCRIRTK